MKRLTWLTKQMLGVLDGFEVAITVRLPPSIRYADFELYAGRAYADFA